MQQKNILSARQIIEKGVKTQELRLRKCSSENGCKIWMKFLEQSMVDERSSKANLG